ncbi:MAG: site-specific integrase [Candidatus Bathyarchaeia archaeon]|jgi:integrase/recombinase XerD
MSKNRPNLRRYTEVQNWLKGKSKGTKCVYTSAIKAFTEYTKMTPVQLIDEAEEDFKKSGREKGAPQRKIIGFFEHLRTEYTPTRNGFSNSKFNGKKGVSVNLACTYSHAIQSFYSANNFPIKVKIQKAVSKKENQKLALRIPDVKRLLDSTTNFRDRAIILTLFQTGMSIQNLCTLRYGDVLEGLEKNEEPLHLDLLREKTWQQYTTFMGKDSIDALKAYLDWRRRNGEVLKLDTPLFTKQFTKSNSKSMNIKAINPIIIEENFQALAVKSGLVSKEKLEAADINPARPHCLRSSFVSILKLAGASNVAVEFLCGHAVSALDSAYSQFSLEELRNLYKKFEKHLSLTGMVDTEKIEALEIKSQTLEQQSKNSQGVIEALLENGRNKDQQVNNIAALLAQVRESLAKLNDEQDFSRLETLTRFVAAKAPSRQELNDFMTKRQIPQSILRRIELQCITFSVEANRWTYSAEDDTFNLIMA